MYNDNDNKHDNDNTNKDMCVSERGYMCRIGICMKEAVCEGTRSRYQEYKQERENGKGRLLLIIICQLLSRASEQSFSTLPSFLLPLLAGKKILSPLSSLLH